MHPIQIKEVQQSLEKFQNHQVYLHLETTNGAYATHNNENAVSSGAYIRNALVEFSHGKIAGNGPYRVGLKMELGWIYAEGLTHWLFDEKGRLLLAGIDKDGKLAVACELSHEPF